MNEIEVITLDNGVEYYQIDSLVYNGVEYLLLSLVSNTKDICIRKIVFENNKEVISYLDDNEFDIIFKKFYEKNKALVS